jgi:hypothetical protein
MLRFLPFSLFLFTYISLSCLNIEAQECGTDELHRQMIQQVPGYKEEIEAMDEMIYQFLQNKEQMENHPFMRVDRCEQGRIYTIPVVVHVIHLGEPIGSGSNITDQRIRDAIAAASNRFLNASAQSQNMEIRFELARRSPAGEPTTGINRVNGSSVPNYATNGISWTLGDGGAEANAIKQLSIWPRDKYYNIWVCHDIAGNIAGYANYPTTWPFEGTVMDYRYMTATNVTLAHELGHGFNLRHTFDGDGDGANCPANANCALQGDQVCDTPPHKRGECSSSSTCADSSANPFNNVSRNIMSYCGTRNLFTPGQKSRAKAALFAVTRYTLVESTGLIPVNPELDAELVELKYNSGNVCSEANPELKIRNNGNVNIDSLLISIKLDNQAAIIYKYTFHADSFPFAKGEERVISSFDPPIPPGNYQLLAEIIKVNQRQLDDYANNDFTCVPFLRVGTTDEKYCTDFETDILPSGSVISSDGNLNPGITTVTTCIDNGEKALSFLPWNINSADDITDEWILPAYNLDNPDGAGLFFDRAHGLSAGVSGLALRVSASVDCGATFNTISLRSGTTLATTSRNVGSNAFVPQNCSEWKRDTLDLDAFKGKELTIKFDFERSSGTSGQNLYLDNLCIRNKYLINGIPSDSAAGSVTGSGKYYEGSTATLTATPKTGYLFDGWEEDGEIISTESSIGFEVIGRRSMVAKFRLVSAIRPSDILPTSLFPNPAKGLVNLTISQNTEGPILIQLMDISGKELKTLLITQPVSGSSIIPIAINDLSRGMYLLRVQTGNASTVSKLVVD